MVPTHGTGRELADLHPLTDDPDLDLLVTSQEYVHGTNPFNSDTDGGGENDGSEVDFANDPLDPSDDEIQEIDWIQAHAANSAVVINFDTESEFSALWLYRATQLQPDWVLINSSVPPTGTYIDTGVTNGVLYLYRMTAIDSDGHRSAVTPTVSARPSADALFYDGFESGNTAVWTTTAP
jgi:hypothetical protein